MSESIKTDCCSVLDSLAKQLLIKMLWYVFLSESHDDSPDIPASGGTLLEKYAEEATQEEDVGQMVTTPPPLPSVSPPHVASGEKDTVAKNWKPLTFRIKL